MLMVTENDSDEIQVDFLSIAKIKNSSRYLNVHNYIKANLSKNRLKQR